jgi:hypothetical protein
VTCCKLMWCRKLLMGWFCDIKWKSIPLIPFDTVAVLIIAFCTIYCSSLSSTQSQVSPYIFIFLCIDVAIHYRCSDNLYGGMGLLSFGTLLKLIPADSRTVYLFTEYGNRLKGTPLAQAATHILHRLYSILSLAFPHAVIVIKRGGNEATAVAQLTLAKKVTICSASTFCFWSGINASHWAM